VAKDSRGSDAGLNEQRLSSPYSFYWSARKQALATGSLRCTADLRDADSGVGIAVDENVRPSLAECVPTWPKAP
jgi:hypothetical protein